MRGRRPVGPGLLLPWGEREEGGTDDTPDSDPEKPLFPPPRPRRPGGTSVPIDPGDTAPPAPVGPWAPRPVIV